MWRGECAVKSRDSGCGDQRCDDAARLSGLVGMHTHDDGAMRVKPPVLLF